MCDLARHCFTFPSATLAGNEMVTIYTGRGVSDGMSFCMGSGDAVWNNEGDTATLYDPTGRSISTHVN